MGITMSKKTKKKQELDVLITFLKETKKGKYAKIDKQVIEKTRIEFTRNDFCFEEDQLIYSYSS